MSKPTTLQTVTTAMLTAFGLILPQVFHFLGNAGTLFSPMHLPVLLCGLICGAFMGGICGLLTPILSCLLFSMPPFPYVIPMTFELIAYGIISGLLGNLFAKIEKTKNFATILSLVISMILGRIINAFASAIMALFTVSDSAFFAVLWTKFIGNFTSTWAGIILQIILIPLIMLALQKSHIIDKYSRD